MKKILLLIALCLVFASDGKAATCWGTSFTAANGHTYCISTQNMNWYAAMGWCDAQGRHLASVNEACDYNGQVYGTNADDCPNIKASGGLNSVVWVNSPCLWGTKPSAHYVSNGVSCAVNACRFQTHPALCY